MSAIVSEATQTCVAGGASPATIVNSAQAGSFVLIIDASALTGIDVLNVKIQRKVRSSGTLRTILDFDIYGTDIDAGTEPVFYSIPVPSPGGSISIVAILNLTAGASNRAIPFSYESV